MKNGNVAVNLSQELVEMFRFSEEFRRQKKLEEEEEEPEKEPEKESVFDRFGDKGKVIQDLENELEEKGKEFIDYHVWPVLPLKF